MKKKLITAMGLVVLGLGQVNAEIQQQPQEPEVGWTTVISTISVLGRGGGYVYECASGRLPWNRGECREFVTGAIGCKPWFQPIESTYNAVRCDGGRHTFPTLTYWVRSGNRFDQVGSVTPTINLPQFCQGPYLFNYTLNVRLPSCTQPCPTGYHSCDPPDPVCPPYCYNILPICCPDGWDCYTAWDPIGELYYGVCCRYNPPWGWQCF